MFFSKAITKLQVIFSVTTSELFFVILVIFGLSAGLIIKSVNGNYADNQDALKLDIYSKLDSLAEANRSTFVGTDFYGKPNPELVSGDTIVEKEQFYGTTEKSKKKEDNISGKIDLNKSSKVELMKLPGIGEKTAVKIIEFRENQAFTKPEDIMLIKGIGPAKYEKMKEFIEVK
jgi:competence ComEA-like helix-hairpin-helix protein